MQQDHLDEYATLAHRHRFDGAEAAGWKKAAEWMYIPFDKKPGIHLQDDGFLMETCDFENTPTWKSFTAATPSD